jgi:uncharacterized protein YjbI with pentapeptide repeats
MHFAEMRTPRPDNLYGTHENSIPFLHRDLAAAHFTSLSLLNRETCQMFGSLSLKRPHCSGRISHGMYLTNVHLVGGCLRGVHLMGVNLMGGCFMGVHLIGGCLVGVLTSAHLRSPPLTSAYLRSLSAQGASPSPLPLRSLLYVNFR